MIAGDAAVGIARRGPRERRAVADRVAFRCRWRTGRAALRATGWGRHVVDFQKLRLEWRARPRGVRGRHFAQADKNAVVQNIVARARLRLSALLPEPCVVARRVLRHVGRAVFYVVEPARFDAEKIRAAPADAHVERAALVVVAVEVHEREHDIACARRRARGVIFCDGENLRLHAAVRLVQEIAVRAAQRPTRLPRLSCRGINGGQLVESEVAVGGVQDRLERVEFFEVRDLLAEVRFVSVKAERARDAVFLTVKNHRRAIDRVAHGVADERLERVVVVFLVVRSRVQEHERLAVTRPALLEDVAVVGRRGRRLQREHDVLVQHIEVPVRAIRHRTAVERLGHENEIPFPGACLVHDVFPALRRKSLAEIRAQSVDAFARLIRRCANWTAGLVEPEEHVIREVFPHVARHVLLRAADGEIDARPVRIGVEKLVALVVVIAVVRRVEAHKRRVFAVKNIVGVGEFSEVAAVGRNGDHARAARATRVIAPQRKEARLGVADFVGRLRVRREILHALRGQFRVVARVIKRRVEHHVHAGAVGGGDKRLKLLHRRGARVRLAHQRIHLEEIFHRIRAADLERRVRHGIGLASVDSVGMNRLKPEPVAAEIFHVIQIEPLIRFAARPVPEINERAALFLRCAFAFDVERVEFVETDVTRFFRRDDDRVIPLSIRRDAPRFAVAAVINPVRIAADLVACGEAVCAGLRRVDRKRIRAVAVRRRGVGLVVIRVVARCDVVAVRRLDAVLDAVAVGVELRAVAAVEVREDFRRRDVQHVRRKTNRNRHRVARDFIDEHMRRRVIGLDAVRRQGCRAARRAERERECLVVRAEVVVGKFLDVCAAMPHADFVFDRREQWHVARARPPHRVACGARVVFDVIHRHRDDVRAAVARDSERAGGIAAVGRVINHRMIGPARGRRAAFPDVADL